MHGIVTVQDTIWTQYGRKMETNEWTIQHLESIDVTYKASPTFLTSKTTSSPQNKAIVHKD